MKRKKLKISLKSTLQKSDACSFYFPKYAAIIFTISFILLCFAYHYPEILNKRPQGLHQWRQCDGLSITMNYFKENRPFFSPVVHSQEADEGKSGATISEFPIIYYLVGNIWKITGHHEYIFRLIDIIIMFLGLLALLKVTEQLLKDSFYAIIVSLFLFLSPVLVYYTNNFIPNTTSFSLILIAWYFVEKYVRTNVWLWLFFVSLFFLLGGLVKVTQNISLMALSGFLIIWLFVRKPKIKTTKIILYLSIAISIFVIIFIYYYYGYHFNKIHHSGMFSFQLHPVWNINRQQISIIANKFITFWAKNYFPNSINYFLTGSIIIYIVFYRKFNLFWKTVPLLLIFGGLVYFAFWYTALSEHDYYIIDLMIIPCFLLLNFFVSIKNNANKIYRSIFLRFMLILIILFSYSATSKKIKNRYSGWMNEVHLKHYHALEDINPYLRKLGISRNDKVLSIPDPSFNISLYLMDQKGYTSGGSNSNGFLMERMLNNGLKYLIINNENMLDDPQIKEYTQYKLGNYENVLIYDLRPYFKKPDQMTNQPSNY